MRNVILVVLAFLAVGCAANKMESNIKEHDFGKVYVGMKFTSPDIRWKNRASYPIDYRGAYGDWGTTGPFSLQIRGPNALPLKNNQTSNPVNVVFAPEKEGKFVGKLNPYYDVGANSPVTADEVIIRGEAVILDSQGYLTLSAPGLKAGKNREPYDFKRVKVGASSPTQNLTVHNSGKKDVVVVVKLFSPGGGPFDVVGKKYEYTVPRNGVVKIPLAYKPTKVGIEWGAVEVATKTDPKVYAGVALTGEGTE